jgi:polyphenol oxidase
VIRTFTTRSFLAGESHLPFDSLNLALHVGDDPRAVKENRARLSQHFGVPIQYMDQVHGADVRHVDKVIPDPTVDALITMTPGLGLAVMVADCIPLLIWDESESVVAAVHVGRRGAINGIVENVVGQMRSLTSASLVAEIGPHICADCYVVGEEIAAEFGATHSNSVWRRDDLTLDLSGALRGELAEMKVRVTHHHSCTVEDPLLYSYRRDGVTGRFAGVISLPSA